MRQLQRWRPSPPCPGVQSILVAPRARRRASSDSRPVARAGLRGLRGSAAGGPRSVEVGPLPANALGGPGKAASTALTGRSGGGEAAACRGAGQVGDVALRPRAEASGLIINCQKRSRIAARLAVGTLCENMASRGTTIKHAISKAERSFMTRSASERRRFPGRAHWGRGRSSAQARQWRVEDGEGSPAARSGQS